MKWWCWDLCLASGWKFPNKALKNHDPKCIAFSCFEIRSYPFSFSKNQHSDLSCTHECSYLHRFNHMHAVSVHTHKRLRYFTEHMSQKAFSKATAGKRIVSNSQKHQNIGAGIITVSRHTEIYPTLRFMVPNLLLHLVSLVSFCQQKSGVTMTYSLCHGWRLTHSISLPVSETFPTMNPTHEQRNHFCSSGCKCSFSQGQITVHSRFLLKEGNVFTGFFFNMSK